jgi:hypothetical protein
MVGLATAATGLLGQAADEAGGDPLEKQRDNSTRTRTRGPKHGFRRHPFPRFLFLAGDTETLRLLPHSSRPHLC